MGQGPRGRSAAGRGASPCRGIRTQGLGAAGRAGCAAAAAASGKVISKVNFAIFIQMLPGPAPV